MASPYSDLLKQLLDSVDGALAVGFADYEGETVELSGNMENYSHRLHLASQGIILHQLQKLHHTLEEVPVQIRLVFHNRHVLIQALRSGYYLVLTLQRAANLFQASRHLERAALELNQDL